MRTVSGRRDGPAFRGGTERPEKPGRRRGSVAVRPLGPGGLWAARLLPGGVGGVGWLTGFGSSVIFSRVL